MIGVKGESRSIPLLLEGCWLALAALIPALFNPASLRVFEPEKIAFLRILALLMVALWALELLSKPGLLSLRTLPARLRDVPFLGPAALLAAVYLLSALLSDLPQVSLLGSYRRQFGAVTHLSYLAVFLVVATHLRTPAQARRLLLAVALGAALPSLYAVAQRFGLDPIPWQVDNSRRVVGSLGQPTFLGAYLAGALPATLYLLLSAPSGAVQKALRGRGPRAVQAGHRPARIVGRFALWALLLLEAAALLFSQSRAAWLGALLGMALLLLLTPTVWSVLGRIGRGRLLVLALAAVALLLSLNLPGTGIHELARSVPYLERVASLADFGTGSGRVRTLIWQTVPSLVAERPLLGHGPEMMGYAFERHYPPELAYAENRTASADAAHNLFLHQLVSTGLVGLLALAWLLVAVGRAALTPTLSQGERETASPRVSASPRLRVGEGPGVGSALVPALGGLVALLVEGMVGVPSASAWLLLWLYLALVASTSCAENLAEVGRAEPPGRVDRARQGASRTSGLPRGRSGRANPTEPPGSRLRPWLWAVAIAVLALAVGGLSLRLNLQPLRADVAAAEASALASQGRFREAAEGYLRALHLSPDREYHLLLGQVVTRAAEGAGPAGAEAYLHQGEEALREAQGLDPLDLDVALAQGKLYQTRAILLQRPADWKSAEDSFQGALALSPRRSYVHNRYGALLAAQGRHEEALDRYRASLALDVRYAATYGFMGDSLAALGRLDQAVEAYREAKRLDPALVLVHINLAELYLRLGRVEGAVGEYREAVALSPGDRELQSRLAALERLR